MSVLKVFVLVSALALTCAEVVDIRPCANDVGSCTVSEARIDPCPQAASHIACQLRRRRPATISYDFTPNFDADTMEASVWWVKDAEQDLPLITLDKEACKYMSCPVKSGVKHTYAVDVPIENKFPLAAYTIKWLLKAPSGEQCCFTTDIKLVR